ncbi:flagellar protein FlaG [Thiomicrorhabdus sp. ZW0627]|uniref:flagellar protein FlaG n=1 Tax=Thiomicrorhabdus sp. ZW0627 TaxID=3039774 RepID=UPI002436820C|nr:flagellar protein FlaG [Thiomicrorhabdus sp. ZW0627]MDG6773354.1 flagellar protein FlaG [Thiomicrorhabdus sp. ZW0627]
MAELSVIQPRSLDSIPVSKSLTPAASAEGQQIDRNRLAQSVEQKTGNVKSLNPAEAKGQINQTQLDSVMNDLNVQLEKLQNYLRFEKDDQSEKMVVFVKNSETDEVIRQIPTEEFLTVSKNITKFLEMRQQLPDKVATPTGLITNEQA